jgi:hypothetical protein
VVEELTGAFLAWGPHHGEFLALLAFCFVDDRIHGEPADPRALVGSSNGDSPDATAQFFLRVIGVAVGANKSDDLIVFLDDARPRLGGVDTRFFLRIGRGSREGFRPGRSSREFAATALAAESSSR